jgi:[ribosomal protein S18]-alanine N-acetyltransferase
VISPLELGIELAPMKRRDLKDVMVIEQVVFPEPWSLAIFHSELALRAGRCYRVARIGRRLVGYFGMLFVDDESHITTIAVDPAYQRRGVATFLMLDVLHTARDKGMRNISLEVAKTNEAAQALYRRFGFAPVGIRKGYYPVTGEDALVMWVYDIDTRAYGDRLDLIESALAARS